MSNESETRPYITVYKSIGGWRAALMWWNPEGYWEPWDTCDAAHEDRDFAVHDAIDWASRTGNRLHPDLEQELGEAQL